MIKMTSFEPRAMIARCVLSSGNADTLEYIVERSRMGKRTGHVGKDRERGLLHTTYNDTLLILKCGELFVRSCTRVSLACPKYGDNKNKNTRTRSKDKEIVFPSHHFNRHKTFDFIRFFCVERRDIPIRILVLFRGPLRIYDFASKVCHVSWFIFFARRCKFEIRYKIEFNSTMPWACFRRTRKPMLINTAKFSFSYSTFSQNLKVRIAKTNHFFSRLCLSSL